MCFTVFCLLPALPNSGGVRGVQGFRIQGVVRDL